MRILIGADVVATNSNMNLFVEGNIKELIGNELLNDLLTSDARIINIEAPITDEWTPQKKAGTPRANLRMPLSTIKGIKAINPTFVTLANNHIMDQGLNGLRKTMDLLNKEGIRFGGIGENIQEAAKQNFLSINNIRIGVYCCAEHEFSIASDCNPGANPFDALESLDHIEKMKSKCDYLIVLYHGGREFYRYPSPELQHRFRRMSDKGANLIVAQHTHCIGCMEEYNGSLLVYGQGNFIFDYKDDDYWNTGMLLDVNITNSPLDVQVSFIPFKKNNGKIKKANEIEAAGILDGFFKRTEEIKHPDVVQEYYREYVKNQLTYFLHTAHGGGCLFRFVNRIMNVIGYDDYIFKKYKEKNLLGLLNYIECEAHVEAFINGIKDRFGL